MIAIVTETLCCMNEEDCAAYGVSTVFHYLIVFAVIMVIGNLLYGGKRKI